MGWTLRIAAGLGAVLAAMLAPAAPAMARGSGGCANGIAHFLVIESAPARQGATLRLMPMRGPNYAQEEEPRACLSHWEVSDPKLARFTPDHRAVIIAADATSGATLTIRYRTRDPKMADTLVMASVTIVARDDVVLTGTRSQQSIDHCDGIDAVGELKLTTDGKFAVTFHPFETYVDYWGDYRFDPATGALAMTVTGGNFKPPHLMLNGTARLEGKQLVLEGMYLGSQSDFTPPATGCTYRF